MGEASQLVQEAVEDVWKRLLLPSLARELRKARTVSAEAHAAGVFGTNLKQVLLAPPLRGTRVLGVDPAYRSGCKLAVLDEQRGLLEKGAVFPHTGSREKLSQICVISEAGATNCIQEGEVWHTYVVFSALLLLALLCCPACAGILRRLLHRLISTHLSIRPSAHMYPQVPRYSPPPCVRKLSRHQARGVLLTNDGHLLDLPRQQNLRGIRFGPRQELRPRDHATIFHPTTQAQHGRYHSGGAWLRQRGTCADV